MRQEHIQVSDSAGYSVFALTVSIACTHVGECVCGCGGGVPSMVEQSIHG